MKLDMMVMANMTATGLLGGLYGPYGLPSYPTSLSVFPTTLLSYDRSPGQVASLIFGGWVVYMGWMGRMDWMC